MNTKAMHKLSYGLYLLTARDESKDNGCVINTCVQVANDPTRVSISVINDNYTCEMVKKSGIFNISVLSEASEFSLYQHFGMQSGKNTDKFYKFEDAHRSANGLFYVTKGTNAWFSCKVVESHDLGSHTLFIAEVVDGEVLCGDSSATYAYYQSSIKPKVKKAEEGKKLWVCSVCGYVYEGESVPDDFICPLCKHGKEEFRMVESAPASQTATATLVTEGTSKWVCSVCGYVYEGDELPDDFHCPVCRVDAAAFKKMDMSAPLAAEHVFGIGTELNNCSAEDKAYILEQLKANFTGECSEVGMYLCMARVAEREGYPEISAYWKKAAYEEAEHAAKFAELLGSELEPNMTASTKKNLAWRVDCEYGATQGKVDLALCAKKNGLDAIHDTVHEMARDEARHGKALEGLLKRYFGWESSCKNR